jgi:hypothetical protein
MLYAISYVSAPFSSYLTYFTINFFAMNNRRVAAGRHGCVENCCENTLCKLRGVFVGVEIYYIGGVCSPPANQVLRSKT